MKKVILVDDDPDTLDALRLVFDPHEYKLITYSNGNAILENTSEIADLYILDKQISGVDGLDICRFLKSGTGTGHVPVIILSASPYINNLAKEAGANDSLEKPFAIKTLREMVKLHLTP